MRYHYTELLEEQDKQSEADASNEENAERIAQAEASEKADWVGQPQTVSFIRETVVRLNGLGEALVVRALSSSDPSVREIAAEIRCLGEVLASLGARGESTELAREVKTHV